MMTRIRQTIKDTQMHNIHTEKQNNYKDAKLFKGQQDDNKETENNQREIQN